MKNGCCQLMVEETRRENGQGNWDLLKKKFTSAFIQKMPNLLPMSLIFWNKSTPNEIQIQQQEERIKKEPNQKSSVNHQEKAMGWHLKFLKAILKPLQLLSQPRLLISVLKQHCHIIQPWQQVLKKNHKKLVEEVKVWKIFSWK